MLAFPRALVAALILVAGFAGSDPAEAASGAACGGMPVAAGEAAPLAALGAPALPLRTGGGSRRAPSGVLLDGVALPHAAGEAARRSLAERLSSLAGRRVVVYAGAVRLDRRGRIPGQVTVDLPHGPVWLQAELVREGLAVVSDAAGACARALLSEEARARAAGRGLFAGRGPDLDAREPSAGGLPDFVILSGRVVSVGKTESTTYLNFGRDRRTDATVRISRRISADFPAEKEPGRLAGASVRVRGWAYPRDGLDLALSGPDAIEIIEEQRLDR